MEITASIDTAASITPSSPQDNWDALKALVQDIARHVSRDRSNALERPYKRLQRKRNRICRQYSDPRIRAPLLHTIEKQIGMIQREIATNLCLRAGKHWREQGETSAGYLKRTIASRSIKKSITSLINPITNTLCTDPISMQTAASSFYAALYSCDAMDSASINSLCATIPDSNTITDADHDTLQQPFTIADLLTGTHRTKFQSSPGIDGLPYPILNIILNHRKAAQLAVKMFNDALNLGIFPSSWLQTCICLLPKSGDLSNLKNWRPLSLICCDAKIFTRLLNQRLMPFMNKIICLQQSGFMPGHFIVDNGMILNNTCLIAAETSSDSIALLLDQEKAYDRIHPDYLWSVMHRFNLPTNIIHSLMNLLFSTQIHININGHISTSSITQQRGIRQGDPISPLLFNIAFDPFLRSIQQDPQFTGFNLHTEAPSPTNHTTSDDISVPMQQLFPDIDGLAVSPDTPASPVSPSSTPLAVKILAYADDTLVYLHDTQDFHRLQTAITMYMKASNALLNYHKTVATSLSGKPSAACITQRNVAFQNLYDSIRNAIALHSQRNLSIRGRTTILNSLIYSKLSHVLRLTTFTKAQLLSLRSLGTSFINFRISPRLSFATLSLPRSAGGLGLLDPLSQQQTLQWYWVCPLLLQYLASPAFPKYTTPSLSVLTYTLSWCYYSTVLPHFFYYLLFPYARHRSWFPQSPSRRHSYLNPITNLQSCLSLFQITERHNLYVDAVTCYLFPLYDILLHSPPTTNTLYSSSFIPPNLLLDGSNVAKKLLVSDIFQLDADLQVLRVRSSFQFANHPIVSQRVADFINSRQLLFQPFFAQQCFIAPRPALDPHQLSSLRAFCRSIFVPPSSSSSRSRLPLNSIRFFKKLRHNLPSSSFSLSPLQPPQWRSFWTLAIPLAARTVWYRAIYEKIPTRALLHLRIPDNHPSRRCTICPASPTEDITHALFSCPPKLLVWRYMYHTYLSASPSIYDVDLIHFLQQTLLCSSPLLDRDPSLSFNELSIP
ncbi:peroxisomal targeting signal 2 receptor [Mucor velutinosus]|uniref:Peroxisomal targeting signal 2 receptor n=1 Tax=Mucor velutinosus TaxID=708070 RepID=A0AAN7DPC9_9FUNG|nr:peroxisomal targeting signal 2 receptor [Mucor velutinosus]